MNILSKIKPFPQCAELGTGKVVLGSLGAADFTVKASIPDCALAQAALSYFQKELSAKMDACAACASGTVEISLTISDDIPAEVKKNADQAYRISVKNDQIELIGFGSAGLYYAVTTFMQCLEIENGCVTVHEMQLLDWPDLKTRGHFMECRYASNLMTLDDWKGVVDDMVSMKMNQLVVALYGCWCVQYDGIISEYCYIPVPEYPKLKSDVYKRYYSPKTGEWVNEIVEVPMVKEDFFGDLIAYGKSRGVEVLPLWNSYGHNTLLPRMYPEISAVHDGKPSGHSLCTTNPKTTEVLCNIFDSIIDRYLKPNGIESFHIGMDEVWNETATEPNDLFRVISPWCECDECKKLSNNDKFINHAIKLIAHLKSRGMKNIYIYSDMMARGQHSTIDPADFKKLLEEHDLMDVTVVDWWTYSNDKTKLMFQTMRPDLGMRATIKPWNSYYHWNISNNAVPNIYHLSEMASREENAEGLQSYSAWDRVNDKNHLSMADYSWNFAATGAPEEYTEKYAARVFGARYIDGYRALQILDEISKENGTFLQSSLAYYFFSYVRAGKPYPRNYPGESMEMILGDRTVYEMKLHTIVEQSTEALALFNSLATDPSVDTDLARRLACEVNNYLCLAKDFIALLAIHDLMAKPERSKAVSAAVIAIAKERKAERLSLMLKMELVKDAFLIPSHLRNQSIYMMVFADIEAYAASVAPDALQLDVCDLREIGSKAFYKLR